MRRPKLFAMLLGAVACACTPALDWREVRPEGSGLLALFPCKPTSQLRITTLAGARVPMTLAACSAAGLTFALGHAELGDPAHVTPALAEMRGALAANLGASAAGGAAWALAGATPNPEAVRVRLVGHAPDGAPLQEEAVLFARGTRVYQAAVLGARLDAGAVNVFFESLRVPK